MIEEISTSKMRTIDDDNNNDEIHLKNDPFNIQVYTFIVDKISN
jgi:hypothetical protein